MIKEEKAKFIEENKEKNYLFISPRIIKGGAVLVDDDKTLELYENIGENTKKIAEKEIIKLISNAKYSEKEEKNYLNFNLIFCGDFDDLPNGNFNPVDFIMENKEKIIAVYRYVKSRQPRNIFVRFSQTEEIYNYDYLYLSLEKLLEEFEKKNIKYEIDTTEDRDIPSMYRDEKTTKFVISYSPKKEKEREKVYQLKK